MPPYVKLNDMRVVPETGDPEVPRYLEPQHGPFRPTGPGLANLRLPNELSGERFAVRRACYRNSTARVARLKLRKPCAPWMVSNAALLE